MRPWSEEKLFFEGEPFYDDLCTSIRSAQSTIDLETYIFQDDRVGRRVIEELVAAARRGVRVRLLLDGVGCARLSYSALEPYLSSGLQIRFFHPLPWQHERFPELWKGMALRKLILGYGKLNRRNHRKTCVVDGTTAYVGGMNISASDWRDTSARVQGFAVLQLMLAFENAWEHPRSLMRRRKRELSATLRSHWVRLNVTRMERRKNYLDLVKRILRAENRVWITNPYFVPDWTLVRALRYAAWLGVDVRVLLPEKTDIFGMKWAVSAFYHLLLGAGVRIFEYRPKILHAKTIIIDQWTSVGSSNLNHRSLFHDLEVDVVLRAESSIRSLSEQFLSDLRSAREIEFMKWRKRPWTRRTLERLALCFKGWM